MIAFPTGHAENADYNGNVKVGDTLATAPEMQFHPHVWQAPVPSGSCNNPDWYDARKRDCMMSQNQHCIRRIFFDLHDPDSGAAAEPIETFYTNPSDPNTAFSEPNFDQFDGHPYTPASYAIMDVLLNYLGESPCNPAYEDRGQIHLDLVDVLDGMRCRGHLTEANTEVLLHDVMDYNYDFPIMSCNTTALECP